MSRKIVVFAGTTEGRLLAAWMAKEGLEAVFSTATEYGARVLETELEQYGTQERLQIRYGRMDEEAMADFLDRESPALVVDATHPYADQATAVIRGVCEKRPQITLLRCFRQEERAEEGELLFFDSAGDVVSWLSEREGRIFLTTGSKDLETFTALPDYKQRLVVRVLPMEASVRCCRELGIEGRQIVAMQGPFSQEMNRVLLEEYGCSYLVTKDSGKPGGFWEKQKAAKQAGARVLVIRRPEDQGLSLEEIKKEIKERMKEWAADQ